MIAATDEESALTFIAYQIYIVEYQCGSIDINQSQAQAAEQKPKNTM